MPQPVRQWFIPGDGIVREVITADIQRYLGNDALVKPGQGINEYQGVEGYWITAYRNLTSEMVQDLKQDSARFLQESSQRRGISWQDSRTYESRQAHGPTPSQSGGYYEGTRPHPGSERQPAGIYATPHSHGVTAYQYPPGYPQPGGYQAPSTQYVTAPGYPAQPGQQPRANPGSYQYPTRREATESPTYGYAHAQQDPNQYRYATAGAPGVPHAQQGREAVYSPQSSNPPTYVYDSRYVQQQPSNPDRSRRK